MHEVNVRLPIPDELWTEIAELAEKKSSDRENWLNFW